MSDPLRLIAGGLETVETKGLEAWLAKYFAREDVSTIVVGKPSRTEKKKRQLKTQQKFWKNRRSVRKHGKVF